MTMSFSSHMLEKQARFFLMLLATFKRHFATPCSRGCSYFGKYLRQEIQCLCISLNSSMYLIHQVGQHPSFHSFKTVQRTLHLHVNKTGFPYSHISPIVPRARQQTKNVVLDFFNFTSIFHRLFFFTCQRCINRLVNVTHQFRFF